MKLYKVPSKILTRRCTDETLPTEQECLGSYAVMRLHNGMGISAPQVGLNKRFFWIETTLFANPVITAHSPDSICCVEGCLSISREMYEIERYKWIEFSSEIYLLDTNELTFLEDCFLSGSNGQCFQHEYDHLEGLLINRGKKYEVQ